jgi:hypothetical protein
MTTWNLLEGYGILKPDVLTFGTNIRTLAWGRTDKQCEVGSGTSISSAIVSASTALALSQIQNPNLRKQLSNGAFIKSALIKSARPIDGLSITEQGAGVFDLDEFMRIVRESGKTLVTEQG